MWTSTIKSSKQTQSTVLSDTASLTAYWLVPFSVGILQLLAKFFSPKISGKYAPSSQSKEVRASCITSYLWNSWWADWNLFDTAPGNIVIQDHHNMQQDFFYSDVKK